MFVEKPNRFLQQDARLQRKPNLYLKVCAFHRAFRKGSYSIIYLLDDDDALESVPAVKRKGKPPKSKSNPPPLTDGLGSSHLIVCNYNLTQDFVNVSHSSYHSTTIPFQTKVERESERPRSIQEKTAYG